VTRNFAEGRGRGQGRRTTDDDFRIWPVRKNKSCLLAFLGRGVLVVAASAAAQREAAAASAAVQREAAASVHTRHSSLDLFFPRVCAEQRKWLCVNWRRRTNSPSPSVCATNSCVCDRRLP
jgi:hypothetical protein